MVSELLQREANVDAATKVSVMGLMSLMAFVRVCKGSTLQMNEGYHSHKLLALQLRHLCLTEALDNRLGAHVSPLSFRRKETRPYTSRLWLGKQKWSRSWLQMEQMSTHNLR